MSKALQLKRVNSIRWLSGIGSRLKKLESEKGVR